MAKKNLMKELGDIYKAQEHQAGSKEHPTITPEEAAQRKKEGRTRGAKGAKMDRINMAFYSDNFEYIRIMSKIRGQSMTEFCNDVIAEHREKYPEQFEQAREIIEQMSKK
jgi:hypothetical protein